MKRIELPLGQIIAGSARPDWTLLALSSLLFSDAGFGDAIHY
jgi:hypothetical protein